MTGARDYDDEEDPDEFVTCTEKYSAYLIAILTVVVSVIMILLLNSVAPTFCNPNDLACSNNETEERMYSDYGDDDDYPEQLPYKEHENVPTPDVNEEQGESNADDNEAPPRPPNGQNSDEIDPKTKESTETTDDGKNVWTEDSEYDWSNPSNENSDYEEYVYPLGPPNGQDNEIYQERPPNEVYSPRPPNGQNTDEINPETQESTGTTDDGDWSNFIDQNPEVGVNVHHPRPPNRPHIVRPPYLPNEQNSDEINQETQESTGTTDDGDWSDFIDQNPEVGVNVHHPRPPNRPHIVHSPYLPNEQNSDEIKQETQELTETTDDGDWSSPTNQTPKDGVDVHHSEPPNKPHDEVHPSNPPREQNSDDINPETQESTETTDDGDWSNPTKQFPEDGVDVHHSEPPNKPHDEVHPSNPPKEQNSDDINPETQESTETTDDGDWSSPTNQTPKDGVDVHYSEPPNKPHDEVHPSNPPKEQNSDDINPETQESTETTDDGDWSNPTKQFPEDGVDVHHSEPPNKPHDEVHPSNPPKEQNSDDINPETQESTETTDDGDWSSPTNQTPKDGVDVHYSEPPNKPHDEVHPSNPPKEQNSDDINPETQESTETTDDGDWSNPTKQFPEDGGDVHHSEPPNKPHNEVHPSNPPKEQNLDDIKPETQESTETTDDGDWSNPTKQFPGVGVDVHHSEPPNKPHDEVHPSNPPKEQNLDDIKPETQESTETTDDGDWSNPTKQFPEDGGDVHHSEPPNKPHNEVHPSNPPKEQNLDDIKPETQESTETTDDGDWSNPTKQFPGVGVDVHHSEPPNKPHDEVHPSNPPKEQNSDDINPETQESTETTDDGDWSNPTKQFPGVGVDVHYSEPPNKPHNEVHPSNPPKEQNSDDINPETQESTETTDDGDWSNPTKQFPEDGGDVHYSEPPNKPHDEVHPSNPPKEQKLDDIKPETQESTETTDDGDWSNPTKQFPGVGVDVHHSEPPNKPHDEVHPSNPPRVQNSDDINPETQESTETTDNVEYGWNPGNKKDKEYVWDMRPSASESVQNQEGRTKNRGFLRHMPPHRKSYFPYPNYDDYPLMGRRNRARPSNRTMNSARHRQRPDSRRLNPHRNRVLNPRKPVLENKTRRPQYDYPNYADILDKLSPSEKKLVKDLIKNKRRNRKNKNIE